MRFDASPRPTVAHRVLTKHSRAAVLADDFDSLRRPDPRFRRPHMPYAKPVALPSWSWGWLLLLGVVGVIGWGLVIFLGFEMYWALVEAVQRAGEVQFHG